jgi:hypothetical protein
MYVVQDDVVDTVIGPPDYIEQVLNERHGRGLVLLDFIAAAALPALQARRPPCSTRSPDRAAIQRCCDRRRRCARGWRGCNGRRFICRTEQFRDGWAMGERSPGPTAAGIAALGDRSTVGPSIRRATRIRHQNGFRIAQRRPQLKREWSRRRDQTAHRRCWWTLLGQVATVAGLELAPGSRSPPGSTVTRCLSQTGKTQPRLCSCRLRR